MPEDGGRQGVEPEIRKCVSVEGQAHATAAVELILRKIAEGADEATLLAAYPMLTKADIQAAVTYAADSLAHEKTVVLTGQR